MICEVSTHSQFGIVLLLTIKASAVLNFADPGEVDAVRRLLYNAQGLLQERFVLVEIPSALYAGFYWTLKQLQNQFKSEKRLSFLSSIASSEAGASPEVSPPVYTNIDGICVPARRVAHQRCPNWDGLIDIEADGLIGVSSCKRELRRQSLSPDYTGSRTSHGTEREPL